MTVAPEGTVMSHLEWFEAEGWITNGLYDQRICLPARHALFFYKGIGFFVDASVVKEASRWAKELRVQYRQERLGTIESLTKDER